MVAAAATSRSSMTVLLAICSAIYLPSAGGTGRYRTDCAPTLTCPHGTNDHSADRRNKSTDQKSVLHKSRSDGMSPRGWRQTIPCGNLHGNLRRE